jgi:hypothetical protein
MMIRNGRVGHFASCARNFGMAANVAAAPDSTSRRVNVIYSSSSLYYFVRHLLKLARRCKLSKAGDMCSREARPSSELRHAFALPISTQANAWQLCDLPVDERQDLIVRFHQIERLGTGLRHMPFGVDEDFKTISLSFPKIPSGPDSPRKVESSHHWRRCLQSCTRSEVARRLCVVKRADQWALQPRAAPR